MIKHYDKTWENCSNKIIASFVSTRENFSSGRRGIRWLETQQYFKKDAVYKSNGEFLYEDLPELNKFKNSKVLIVGGGPSARDVNWAPEKYDYIISLNHFYNLEKLKNMTVDLAFVGNEVNTKSKEFLEYFDSNPTLIAVEDLEHRPSHIRNLQQRYGNRVMLCSSRIQCKSLGAGPKLIVCALTLGAKQVDVIGIDGVPKNYNPESIQEHSFESNKKWDKKYSYDTHIHHYRTLNFYLKETFPNQIVNNLGKGHPYNCWSHA